MQQIEDLVTGCSVPADNQRSNGKAGLCLCQTGMGKATDRRRTGKAGPVSSFGVADLDSRRSRIVGLIRRAIEVTVATKWSSGIQDRLDQVSSIPPISRFPARLSMPREESGMRRCTRPRQGEACAGIRAYPDRHRGRSV
jgi:hypothetical protein